MARTDLQPAHLPASAAVEVETQQQLTPRQPVHCKPGKPPAGQSDPAHKPSPLSLPPLQCDDPPVLLPQYTRPKLVWADTDDGEKLKSTTPPQVSPTGDRGKWVQVHSVQYSIARGMQESWEYLKRVEDGEAVVVVPIIHRADGSLWTIITEEARASLQSTVFGFAAGLIEVKHRLEAVTEDAQERWPQLTERERAAGIAAIQEAREELGLCLPSGTAIEEEFPIGACASMKVKAVEGPNYIDPGLSDARQWLVILDIRLKEPEADSAGDLQPLQLPKQQLELGERIRRIPVPLAELETTVRNIRSNGGKVHVTLADIARGIAGLV